MRSVSLCGVRQVAGDELFWAQHDRLITRERQLRIICNSLNLTDRLDALNLRGQPASENSTSVLPTTRSESSIAIHCVRYLEGIASICVLQGFWSG